MVTSSTVHTVELNNTALEIPISTVARFRYDSWFKMGDLLNPRYYHSAILVGDEVLVVGGKGT